MKKVRFVTTIYHKTPSAIKKFKKPKPKPKVRTIKILKKGNIAKMINVDSTKADDIMRCKKGRGEAK